MSAKRKVIHALFDYTRTDDAGKEYRGTALRGEVIEVNDGDLARGERLGALVATDVDIDAVSVVPEPAPPVAPALAGKLLDDRKSEEAGAAEKPVAKPASRRP